MVWRFGRGWGSNLGGRRFRHEETAPDPRSLFVFRAERIETRGNRCLMVAYNMMLMDSREIHRRAKVFLTDAVAKLKRLPSDAIRAWPEFPPSPSIDLNVP